MATVNTGDSIQAAQYNDLQSRVNTIMGTGTGQNGYGQTLASSTVLAGSVVTATQMDELRTDINKANNHQSGSDASIANIAVGNVIGADATGSTTSSLSTTDGGYNDYDAAVTLITTNKFLIDPTQGTLDVIDGSTRTTNWSNEIQHIFTCDFSNANNARHYFNTGSDIRISLSLTGQSGSKSNTWSTLLSTMGTVIFNHTTATQTGSGGTSAGLGWYDMTTSYQQVFIQDVGAGVYTENNVVIDAKKNSSSTTLQIRIRVIDADVGDQQPGYKPGPGEDESVNGTLSSNIQKFAATGSNVVAPTFSTTTNTEFSAGS